MASVPVPGAGVDEIWAMASNVIANSGKTGQYKRIQYTVYYEDINMSK